jgi:D-alanyl-D-alanine carboxypeptidase
MLAYLQSKHSGIRWMEIISIIILMSVVLVFSSCSSSDNHSASTFSLSPEVQQELERIVDEVMSTNSIPGAVVGVWVPGEGTWVEAKGLANIETRQATDLAYKFRMGSITKTFVATRVLQLYDLGEIELEDPLDKYVFGVPNGGEITISMLLNHTSGLYDYTSAPSFNAILDREPSKHWSPQELIGLTISHDPDFPPGERWSYCNTNYILLGMIIEQETGNGITDEMKTGIMDILGLSNTSFPEGPQMNGQYIHGYCLAEQCFPDEDGDGLRDVTCTYDPSFAWAAGAMISNMEDLKVWAKALADGEMLSEASQEERLTFIDACHNDVCDGAQYGLGVLYYAGFLGHGGDYPGFTSAMFHHPSEDVTIVLSLNKNPNETHTSGLAYETFKSMVAVIFP